MTGYNWFRVIFQWLIVKPLAGIVLGLNIRNPERLPQAKQVIIVANHNSHLDTLVLLSLFPWRSIHRVRPVAAADYFLRTPLLAWFSLNVLGIIPLDRANIRRGEDPLQRVRESLGKGESIIIFPEGSRGEPEELAPIKGGVTHLLKDFPELPVLPIFMFGLGRSLPRGEAVLVPFFVDVFVGEELKWSGNKNEFLAQLDAIFKGFAEAAHPERWEDGRSDAIFFSPGSLAFFCSPSLLQHSY